MEISIEEVIASYDWDYDTALAIAQCESALDPQATNEVAPDASYGLFQINTYGDLANHRPSKEELFTVEVNVEYAYKLYKEGGWERHWTNCYRKIKGV